MTMKAPEGPTNCKSLSVVGTSMAAGFTLGIATCMTYVRYQLAKRNQQRGMVDRVDLAKRLFRAGCVRFGKFTLKSGIESPIYFDLRVIVSYPKLLQDVARAMFLKIVESDAKFDLICGVPYTALPIATVMATDNQLSMVMRRKEAKKHGTKKIIEGHYEDGQTVLVVEDLVTSAMSCFETIKPLRDVGLHVNDVVVLLDREQGGEWNLQQQGKRLLSVFKVSNLLDILLEEELISNVTVTEVKRFLNANNTQVGPAALPLSHSDILKAMTYTQRSELCKNQVASKLLKLMEDKKTNLCVSADLTRCSEVLELADRVGRHICMLKTHVDILSDYTLDFPRQLQEIASKHSFIIFEDRKYADIGNTVKAQYTDGIYRVSEWAEITNAHIVSGPGIIEGLKASIEFSKKFKIKDRGLLLLAEMSSKDNLLGAEFKEKALEWADLHKDFVIGFISMGAISASRPYLIHMTPGVSLAFQGDTLGQQYKTPGRVIGEQLSDVIIVGRGIYRDDNPAEAAKRYQEAGWSAYQERLNSINNRREQYEM